MKSNFLCGFAFPLTKVIKNIILSFLDEAAMGIKQIFYLNYRQYVQVAY